MDTALPIITADYRPVWSEFLESPPSQNHVQNHGNTYIAAGDSRQIAGNINTNFTGPVNKVENYYHRHEPAARPDIPPIPSSTVPFPRDREFVERTELLTLLNEHCIAPASRTALVGIGGVGKSQIAIEYSYQVRERRPQTWVFWIHASNAARFMQGIRELADAVMLPDRADPNADILRSVHNWLHDERKGKWLLILDNVDDAAFLSNPPGAVLTQNRGYSRRLIDYLPPSKHGAILITSRIKSEARKLIEENDILVVSPMQGLEAKLLLQRKLGSDPDDPDEATKLVTTLEFMPLAIVQAASYIRENQPRCSIQSYLAMFSRSLSEQTSLLAHEAGGLRRDPEAKNSIFLTWQVSFEHLRKVRPSAADLLSFMCFFDRQGISTRLLQQKGRVWKRTSPCMRAALLFPRARMINDYEPSRYLAPRSQIKSSPAELDSTLENDILTLTNYIFITSRDDGTFEIHRLFQLATRAWLQKQREFNKWKREFIKTLWLEFPEYPNQPWRTCQELYPHVKSASKQPLMLTGIVQRLRWFCVLLRAADFAGRSGNISDAESMFMQAYELTKRWLGWDIPDPKLEVLNRFAHSLTDVGRHEEAEAMYRLLFERSERKFGPNHNATVYRLIPIAKSLSIQNKHAEAETIHRRSLRHFEQKLGANHLDTLCAASSLGNALMYQGKYGEAETMLKRALIGWETVLGPESDYATANTIDIGILLVYQGKNEAAVTMFQRALIVTEKRLGSDHPNVLNIFSNLGMALGNRGNHTEAERLFRRALAGFEKITGSRINLRISLVYLSLALVLQNKWTDAEACIRREIAEVEKEPRLSNCYALDSTTKLAYVRGKQGQLEQAERIHQRAGAAGAAGSGSCMDTSLLRSWVQLKEN